MLPQVNLIRARHGDFLSFFERAGISGVLTAHGAWDELTISIAKALLDVSDKPPVVLDIGANMGTFTIPIAKHVADRGGRVHSFEPQRTIFYQLCGNIFLNRLDNVMAHNLALSDRDAEDEIYVLDYHKAFNIGAFSLVPDRDPQDKATVTQPCSFRRLDGLDLPASATLLKIDVEGFELEVFRGASKRIAADGFPPVLFESLADDPRANSVAELLKDAGYSLQQYGAEDWIAQHPAWPSEIGISLSDGALRLMRLR